MHRGVIFGLLLLACSPILPRTDATPSGAGDPAPTPAEVRVGAPGGQVTPAPGSAKLSSRLNILANLAATGSLPADIGEQDRLLSLSGSGAGSLSRDAAGNPIVEARVSDTSAQTIGALTALPADVLSVAAEYATVTLAIAPPRLSDLASIPSVQYVAEVIRPDTNPARNPGALPGGGGVRPGGP